MPEDQPVPYLPVPYLIVLTSSNQLYSGTGTALFEWIRFARSAFDFSIVIDTENVENFKIAREFCKNHGIRLIPSGPARREGGGDPHRR